MPVGVQNFNGKRLTQARCARGLFAVNLADMVGVSQSTISLYERGTQKPKQDVLETMAQRLGVPVGFFLSEIDIEKPSKLFYRSMSAATKSARLRAEARYEWMLEVSNYLLKFFDFPEVNLPELDLPPDFHDIDSLTIESAAEQLRQYWMLGDGPVVDMVRTLESNGIIVWRTELGAETLDAFSEYREPYPFVILSSEKENYFRSRFDAGHELGHLVLHKNVDKSALNKSSDFKLIEDQAHHFSGAFQLPAMAYSKDLWATSLDAFRSLKPVWNASIGMQIKRCKQLGIIDDDQERRLWINLSRRGWRRNEPLDDSTQAEKPNLIMSSIKMLVDERVKTKEQIADELKLSAADITKICNLPAGYMSSTPSVAEPTLKKHGDNVFTFKRQ